MIDVPTQLLLALAIGLAAGWASVHVPRLVRRLRGPHRHEGAQWDGWFEHCRCGASAGDRHGPDGLRLVLFEQWTEDERTVQR